MWHSTENVIRHKIGLLNLAEEFVNVSKACKIMGVSRDTFYRYKEAVESDGVEALIEKSRRKPNRKIRIDGPSSPPLIKRLPVEPSSRGYRMARWARRFIEFADLPDADAFLRSFTYLSPDVAFTHQRLSVEVSI